MIDVEPEIFDEVATAVRTAFPDIFITGETVSAPPSLPCAAIVEGDNSTYARTQTQSLKENHAVLLYTVDVYSNKAVGRKTECRAIADVIDEEFQSMGFTRLFLNPVPNLANASIYRINGRYQAAVSKIGTIYRR